MNFFLKTYYLLKHLGPGLLVQRAGLVVRDRLGMTRRVYRRQPWRLMKLSDLCEAGVETEDVAYASLKRRQALPFFFKAGQPPRLPAHVMGEKGNRLPSLDERLALLKDDRCVYFFRTPGPEKNDWHKNPFTGGTSIQDQVWSDLPFFDKALGDARVMWEPSRAAWAYDLARAFARDGDESHADEFWRWVDNWMEENQPFDGFQWKCGQESAVRFMAIVLGFWTFAEHSTPQRWVQMAKLAWATGYRIEHHIEYAISQRNNHALSEACGLMLIGYLFPEFHDAARWRIVGRRVLEEQLREQIYDDGSYIQHSFNYHRVMLQVSLVGLRVAELAQEPFDRHVYDLLDKSNAFLHTHMDERSGRVPNYGNNDGAWVCPFSECDFLDYRPTLQAVHFLVHRERLLPAGMWDEDLCWFFGDEANDALKSEVPRESRVASSGFESGGYYTLRNDASWVMMRCHTYRDRPAHCDQLHLDLWWQGHNVLRDAGTYLYFAAGRNDVEQYYKSTRAHNTIEIDGREPAEFVSRFLMLPWLRGRMKHYHVDGDSALWMVGERFDYDRNPWNVMHRRSVICVSNTLWLIVDDLFGEGHHSATLRWHLEDWSWHLDAEAGRVSATSDVGEVSLIVSAYSANKVSHDLVRGRDNIGEMQGFMSPYYGEKQAAPVLEVACEFSEKIRMVTAVQLGGSQVEISKVDNDAVLASDGEAWSVCAGKSSYVISLATLDRNGAKVFLSID